MLGHNWRVALKQLRTPISWWGAEETPRWKEAAPDSYKKLCSHNSGRGTTNGHSTCDRPLYIPARTSLRPCSNAHAYTVQLQGSAGNFALEEEVACLLVLYTRVSTKKLAIQMIARNESRNREVLRRLLKRMGAGQAGTCRGEHGLSRCRTPPVQGGALIMSKADRDEKWAYDPGELKRGSAMALFKLRSKRPPYKTVQKGKSSRSSHCNAGGWRGRGVINMDGHCQWQRQAHQPGRHSQSSGNSAAGCSKHKYRTSAGQCC